MNIRSNGIVHKLLEIVHNNPWIGVSSDSTGGLDKSEHHIIYIRLIDINMREIKTFYYAMN